MGKVYDEWYTFIYIDNNNVAIVVAERCLLLQHEATQCWPVDLTN